MSRASRSGACRSPAITVGAYPAHRARRQKIDTPKTRWTVHGVLRVDDAREHPEERKHPSTSASGLTSTGGLPRGSRSRVVGEINREET